jgi:solute carrier family 25 (mitochondrial uncoupling protein), member 8/9
MSNVILKRKKQNNIYTRFFSSSTAIFIAETCSLPFDVIKTRLQIQNNNNNQKIKYNGLSDCFKKIYTNEGTKALWKGWTPAIIRSISYGSLAVVLYDPIRNYISKNIDINDYSTRFISGGLSGAIAITIFNPTEVIKTQLQSHPQSHNSILSLSKNIYNTRGIIGFWSGVKPNITRTFVVNASELGTYDWIKNKMLNNNYTDGPMCHISSSFGASIVSTTTSTPIDVIKTRLMSRANEKINTIQLIKDTYKNEGINSFFKGYSSILIRKTIWCTLFFVSYENFKLLF